MLFDAATSMHTRKSMHFSRHVRTHRIMAFQLNLDGNSLKGKITNMLILDIRRGVEVIPSDKRTAASIHTPNQGCQIIKSNQ